MQELSDAVLYRQWLENPQEGFAAIYRRYGDPLFRYIYRLTGQKPAAEEILHDVFFKFIAGHYRELPDSQLKNWFYAVARNQALNFCKRVSFETSTSAEIMDGREGSTDLESEYATRQLQDRFKVAEGQLPRELDETWRLRKQGMDYQQIAKTLDIPLGTVKSRFSRLAVFFRKEI